MVSDAVIGLALASAESIGVWQPAKQMVSDAVIGLALASSQRAMVAAGIANLQKGDNQHKKEGPSIGGPSTDDAAKQMSVSPKSVERAKAVKDKERQGLPTWCAMARLALTSSQRG